MADLKATVDVTIDLDEAAAVLVCIRDSVRRAFAKDTPAACVEALHHVAQACEWALARCRIEHTSSASRQRSDEEHAAILEGLRAAAEKVEKVFGVPSGYVNNGPGVEATPIFDREVTPNRSCTLHMADERYRLTEEQKAVLRNDWGEIQKPEAFLESLRAAAEKVQSIRFLDEGGKEVEQVLAQEQPPAKPVAFREFL